MSKINAMNKLLGRLVLSKFGNGLNAYFVSMGNGTLFYLFLDVDHKRYDFNSSDYDENYKEELDEFIELYYNDKINDILKYLGEEKNLSLMLYNHMNTEIYSEGGEIYKETQTFLDRFLKGYNAVNEDSLHFIKTKLEFFDYSTSPNQLNPKLKIQTNFDAGDVRTSMKFFMAKSSSPYFFGYYVFVNGTSINA